MGRPSPDSAQTELSENWPFSVDYWKLDRVTICDLNLLLCTDDCIQTLLSAEFFSTLECIAGFVKYQSERKTVIKQYSHAIPAHKNTRRCCLAWCIPLQHSKRHWRFSWSVLFADSYCLSRWNNCIAQVILRISYTNRWDFHSIRGFWCTCTFR